MKLYTILHEYSSSNSVYSRTVEGTDHSDALKNWHELFNVSDAYGDHRIPLFVLETGTYASDITRAFEVKSRKVESVEYHV